MWRSLRLTLEVLLLVCLTYAWADVSSQGNRNIEQLSFDSSGNVKATATPSSATTVGITPIVSGSAEASHVLKASAGNLYSVYATNLTATPGFLVVLNATSAPGDGAITPLDCVVLPASGTAVINYNPGPPAIYSTGITAVVTSATTCFTKTVGVITAFMKGAVK